MDERRRFWLGGGSSHLCYLGVLGVCLAGALFASFAGRTALAAFLLLLSALGLGSRLWGAASLGKLSVELEAPSYYLFPGQEAKLRCRVENRKLLPVFWLEVCQPLPDSGAMAPGAGLRARQISLLQRDGSFAQRPVLVQKVTFLLWRQSVEWEAPWEARRRGLYLVEEVCLRSGDGLGLAQVERYLPLELPRVFVVYPKIQPVRTELFLRDLWDSQWGGRGYMEDVTVLKSARPYQGADSWKRINWRMAARQQQLQVNLFETILPRAAHFILDGQSFLEDPEGLEDALSLLASVCLRLGEAGVPCGLSLPGGADHPPRNLFAADGAAPEDLLFALAEYRLREAPAWLREEEELEPYRLSGFDRDGLLRGSSRAGRICLLTREMESFRCWSLLEGLEAASLMVLTYREPPADLPALEFPVIPLDAVREGGRSR